MTRIERIKEAIQEYHKELEASQKRNPNCYQKEDGSWVEKITIDLEQLKNTKTPTQILSERN